MLSKSILKAGCVSVGVVFACIKCADYIDIIVHQNLYLGDNCIQNFHFGRYIVGYTVGNLVLRRRPSGDIKRDFRTHNG